MKAIRYYAPQDIRYEEVDIKEPDKGEVLVKIEVCSYLRYGYKDIQTRSSGVNKKNAFGFRT